MAMAFWVQAQEKPLKVLAFAGQSNEVGKCFAVAMLKLMRP